MKTVLTTGTNSGIGLATAIAAARAGYRSIGTVRSEEKASVVTAAARAAGVEVETRILDVTNADRCAEVIEEIRPWGLVNNAGYGLSAAIEEVDDDEARAMLEAMVIAPARLCRLSIPHMRRAGEGRIVNVSSVYGIVTTPFTGWYQASKHALEGLSDALRVEMASAGISVVLVEPGLFRTSIWEEAQQTLERAKTSEHYAEAYRTAIARLEQFSGWMGEPEAVAETILTALSAYWPKARYLVGIDARTIGLVDPVVPTFVRDWIARLTLRL